MTTLIPKFDLKQGLATPAGAVNRTIQEKFEDTISVKDFGAIGNGIADDTAALQAALNSIASGGSLYFPFGTYNHTGLSLIGSNINLYGDGATLVYSGVSDGFLIQSANNTNASNFSMSGLTFKNGVSAFKIKGQGTGVYSNINITNCIFDTSTSGMVWFEHCSDTVFDGNELYNGGDNGVYYSFSRNCVISNNIVANCYGSGGIVAGYSDITVTAQNISIVGNQIYCDENSLAGNYQGGIDVVMCVNAIISGNQIGNNANAIAGQQYKNGIILEENGISNVRIADNIIYNIPEVGIRVGFNNTSVISNIVVANNTIQNVLNGITVNRTINSQVINNSLNNISNFGVQINSACLGINVVNNVIVTIDQQSVFASFMSVYVNAPQCSVTGNTFIDSQIGGTLTSSVASPTYSIDGSGVLKLYTGATLLATISTLGLTWSALKTAIDAVAGWTYTLFPNCGDLTITSIRRTGPRANDAVSAYSVPSYVGTAEPAYYVFLESSATGAYVTDNSYKTNVLQLANNFTAGQMFNYRSDTYYDLTIYGGGRKFSGATAPASGSYLIGDIVYNNAPTVSGYIGWVCTVAGAPGTWKQFGLIT